MSAAPLIYIFLCKLALRLRQYIERHAMLTDMSNFILSSQDRTFSVLFCDKSFMFELCHYTFSSFIPVSFSFYNLAISNYFTSCTYVFCSERFSVCLLSISGWNALMACATSLLSMSMQIRFGIAMSAFAISEKLHTRLSVCVQPRYTTKEKSTL